jgi:hypothetical protein
MSYDQHSSYQQPWTAQLSGPSRAAGLLSPQDAEKSRRWRLVLGCTALFLALFSGFYAYVNIAAVIRATNAVGASGGYISESAMALAVAIIGVLCVLAIAYAGIGAWNIAARRSTAKSPLIAAIILAATAFVLIVVYMATKSTGGFQISGLGLNALIFSRAAIVLRMKKAPVYPTAAD